MAEIKKKTAAPTNGASEPKVTHLQVRSLVAGFRRAGRAWPAEEIVVGVDEFSEAQIEQLLAEPMLTVVPVAQDGGA